MKWFKALLYSFINGFSATITAFTMLVADNDFKMWSDISEIQYGVLIAAGLSGFFIAFKTAMTSSPTDKTREI